VRFEKGFRVSVHARMPGDCYSSKRLKTDDVNYLTHDLELAAVVFALKI